MFVGPSGRYYYAPKICQIPEIDIIPEVFLTDWKFECMSDFCIRNIGSFFPFQCWPATISRLVISRDVLQSLIFSR